MLEHASLRLREDIDFMTNAVQQDASALRFAGPLVKENRTLIMGAVNRSARALRYASKVLRADSEIVVAAIQRHWSAILFASEELLQEPVVVLALVQQWMSILEAVKGASSCTEVNVRSVTSKSNTASEAFTASRRSTRAQRLCAMLSDLNLEKDVSWQAACVHEHAP